MSGMVKFDLVEGPMRGGQFRFTEHNTFLLGRIPDCSACLADDEQVSRHHFVIEVNPPQACLRDLGSLNGTYVNGIKYGCRKPEETRERVGQRNHREVQLKDGDEIRVGQTLLRVRIEAEVCCDCGCPISDQESHKCKWIGGTFICHKCREKLETDADAGIRRKDPMPCSMTLGEHVLHKAEREIPSIPGFDLESLIGRGASGQVYLAKDQLSGQRVAVKVMSSRILVDERSRKKFDQEIKVMRQLNHGNIVALLDHGSEGNVFYFVMEFCDGGSVANLIASRGGKLEIAEAASIMLQSLDGLAFAHTRGFVHRDLKPQNLLLVRSPQKTKIGDFGFAKSFQQAGFSGMTVTGSYGGTPHFMAREQVVNFKYVKPVSDVWTIGATFYNMLTGQYPRDFLRGVDPIEIVLSGKVVPILERAEDVPPKVAAVIDRALAREPNDRYQDASEMREALGKALE